MQHTIIHINEEWLQINGKYKCPQCDKEFSKKGIGSHIWSIHTEEGKYMRKNQKPSLGQPSPLKGIHLCKEHKQKISDANKGKPGRKHTNEEKEKISIALKKAHAENRHPGWAHINNDRNRRSYPEKFMLEVFEANHIFKQYTIVEKMSFFKYFLDFAIIELKLCIEVDGCQHYKTEDAIQHDKERDKFLISNGWKVYRIHWQTFINNTKQEIEELINFIKNIDYNINRYYDINEIEWHNKIKLENKLKIKLNKQNLIQEKIKLILNSNIDFAKYGWVQQVSRILKISPQKVNNWMKRNMLDFYNIKCFKRK